MAGQHNGGRTAASVTSSTDDHPAPPHQDVLRAVAERVRGAFPRPFTTTELVLIDVDPATLHAFWTIPLNVARRARRTLGAAETMAPLLLRVRALSDDDQSVTATFDVDVVGLQSQVYVTITRPERFYSADIGVVGRSGVFQALVTSNTARLPRLPRGWSVSGARPAIADTILAVRTEPPATTVAPHAAAAPLPLAGSFPPPPDRPGAYDPALEAGAPSREGAAQAGQKASQPHTDTALSAPGTGTGTVATEHPVAASAPPPSSAGSPPEPRDRGMPLPFVGPFPLPPSEPGAYDPWTYNTGELPAESVASEGQAIAAGREEGSHHETTSPVVGTFPPPPGEAGVYDPRPGSAGGHQMELYHGSPSPVITPFPPPPGEAGVYDPRPYAAGGLAAHAMAVEDQVVVDDAGEAPWHGFEPDAGAPDEAAHDAGIGWSGADAADWAPSSAVFSPFGATQDDQPAIGDVRIEVELFGRARPGHHLFLLGRRVALRPDGTFSCTHRLAGDDATMAVFLNHGGAAAATSVMANDEVAPAARLNGDRDIEGEDERVMALSDLDGDTHDVQLEVNAVLRVSGRTDREGDIHILGRAVTPDAEGRFCLGCPLPHGALFLSALLTAPEHRNDEERG